MNLVRIALFVSLCLADGLLLFRVSPVVAAEIISDIAPPPLRTENVGHPRDGYVWAPGHWEWNGQAYRWVSGGWIVERGKARWIADQWEPAGSQWRFVPGHWER